MTAVVEEQAIGGQHTLLQDALRQDFFVRWLKLDDGGLTAAFLRLVFQLWFLGGESSETVLTSDYFI